MLCLRALQSLADFIQFDQIQLRESEAKELEQLMETLPCAVKVCVFGCDRRGSY